LLLDGCLPRPRARAVPLSIDADPAPEAPALRPVPEASPAAPATPPEHGEIGVVLREHRPRFLACYERGLRSRPDLAGRVEVVFVIGIDGSVTDAIERDVTLPDDAVVSCIVRSLFELTFATRASPVTVVYPLVLTP
jgi:hypothetical protein